uniref:Putative secreted peptide n=1 Tax=Anopheles braziliensis TaxID=58242 RepID=A0A2M3ZX17_9DIPT
MRKANVLPLPVSPARTVIWFSLIVSIITCSSASIGSLRRAAWTSASRSTCMYVAGLRSTGWRFCCFACASAFGDSFGDFFG